MHQSRGLDGRSAMVSASLGAALAVPAVWLLRPDPPSCTVLGTGVRACMPVLVVPPPTWVYLVAGVVGALAALLVHAGVRRARTGR